MTQYMKIVLKWISELFLFGLAWLCLVFIFHIPILIVTGIDGPLVLNDNIIYLLSSSGAKMAASLTVFCFFIGDYKKIKIFISVSRSQIFYGLCWGIIPILILLLVQSSLGFVEIRFLNTSVNILTLFALYIIVAIAEEFLFRGFVLEHASRLMGSTWGIILSSLLFGAIHIGNDHFTWIGFWSISLSGAIMALLVVRFKNLNAAIAMHFAWNFFQGPILGYAVSGKKLDSIFEPLRRSDISFLTGGGFGAEGSIVLLPLLIAGIWYLWGNSFKESMILQDRTHTEDDKTG
jgi:uncharacterized protein